MWSWSCAHGSYIHVRFVLDMWLGVDFLRKMEKKKPHILYITYFGIVLSVGISMYI